MYRQRNAERLVILVNIIPIVPFLQNPAIMVVLLPTPVVNVLLVNLSRLNLHVPTLLFILVTPQIVRITETRLIGMALNFPILLPLLAHINFIKMDNLLNIMIPELTAIPLRKNVGPIIRMTLVIQEKLKPKLPPPTCANKEKETPEFLSGVFIL